ncbi:hypothetical protein GCM10027035_36330 [Emticicia sediminis]
MALLISQNLFAVVKTWTGTTSTNWATASNWSPSGVPAVGDEVILNDVTNDPMILSGTTANCMKIYLYGSLTINNGATLNVLNTTETLNTAITIYTSATLTNNGTLSISSSNTNVNGIFLELPSSTFNNTGTTTINVPSINILHYDNGSTVTNSSTGIINMVSGTGIRFVGGYTNMTFSNQGVVNHSGLSYTIWGSSGSGYSFTNSGIVNVTNGSGILVGGITINNQLCGKIEMTAGSFNNSSSTTTNAGLIQISNALNNTSGTFTNTGVLKYGSQTGNSISNNGNGSVIVNNTTPIFTYGGTFNGTINGIFTNSSATTSAGTFTTPNTFTPSGTLPTGSQTLYAKITPSGGACSYVVPFSYNNVVATPEINLKGNNTNIIDNSSSPSTTNHTDFGSTAVSGGTIVRTFTIENTGTGLLTLGANPVSKSGTHAADFTITQPSVTTVAAGSSTTFSVSFDPSVSGLRTATLSIANDDADENPYTFAIQGTGISDGCFELATPYNSDNSNKGVMFNIVTQSSPVTITSFDMNMIGFSTGVFEIYYKEGTYVGSTTTPANWTLAGSATVTGSGINNPTPIPIALSITIPANSTYGFYITNNDINIPAGVRYTNGTFTSIALDANISIEGGVGKAYPFDQDYNNRRVNCTPHYYVGSNPCSPEISIKGNNTVIADGSSSPIIGNHTDFGSASISGGTVTRTFTIENPSSAYLILSGDPKVVISGTNAADFTVNVQPASPIVSSGSTSFQVTFDPSASGTRTATVSIANNDSDENPYTFAIQGMGNTTCSQVANSTQNMDWNGSVSTDWNNPCNWTPNGVPSTTNFATIEVGTFQPTINSGTATVKYLQIQPGSILTVNSGATLNVSNTASTETVAIPNSGSLINNGTINIATFNSGVTGIRMDLNSASFVNNGTININVTSNQIRYFNGSNQPFNNTGTINFNSNGTGISFNNSTNSSFTNSGTLNYSGTGNAVLMSSGNTFTNSGTFNITNSSGIIVDGGTITNQACGKIIMSAGTYDNSVSGGQTNNSGLIFINGTLNSASGNVMNSNGGVLKYQTLTGSLTIGNNSAIVNNTSSSTIFNFTTFAGTVNGIFTNEAATTSAGTFTAPNTFTPSGLPAGSQTLYAKITPSGGACEYIVPFTYNNVVAPDYTISTTANVITITDVAGNGETINVSESGGNIRFSNANTARTYSIDGGTTTAFTTPADIALSGKTGIVVNTATGDDIVNIGAFSTALPSMTVNGGTGNDNINFNGNISFTANNNLNLDLQNDDASPGTDAISLAANTNIILAGTGTATLKMSKNLTVNVGAVLRTVNGALLVEANQQTTPTIGDFTGVNVLGGTIEATGTGNVTIKGKGGNASDAQRGINLSNGGKIFGGTSGTLTVDGRTQTTTGTNQNGVRVDGLTTKISSYGAVVIVNAKRN